MHPVPTFASYTTGRVHPACHEASDPPPPATATAAAAFFPSVGLSRTVSVWDRYRRRQSIGLGIVQAIIGALCIVFNAVSLGFYDGVQTKSIGFVGHGFWIGMMFIVTGTLGLAAGKSRTRCTITAFMTMCIISATFTIVILSLGVAGAVAASRGGGYSCVGSERGSPYGFNYYYPYYYRPPCYTFQVVVAMEACMAVAGFLEAIVAIWGAVICCQSGICCYSGPSHAMVLPVSYYPNSGHVMYVTHAHEGLQVVYAPPPSMPYSQGTLLAPLSYQTSYSQPAWCRPQLQMSVAGATTGRDHPLNSPPPPYPSDSHHCQPKDYQQKY